MIQAKFSLPRRLDDYINDRAREFGVSRSEVLREVLGRDLDHRRRWDAKDLPEHGTAHHHSSD
jgi:Arc/MetJ-type ribon-helix-helix transcriptional regulator